MEFSNFESYIKPRFYCNAKNINFNRMRSVIIFNSSTGYTTKVYLLKYKSITQFKIYKGLINLH